MGVKQLLSRVVFYSILLLSVFVAKAQSIQDLHFEVEERGIAAPTGKMPFWLRAGQYGAIPPAGSSGSIRSAVYKSYDSIDHEFIDWGGGLEVIGTAGSRSTFTLLQGYLKARAGIFELKAGRTKDVSGIVDTTLSSGAFTISGNALGIPKIELAIPNYYALPMFNKLFAVKGSFGYGFMGNVPVYNQLRPWIKNDTVNYLQSSLYVQLGRADWKLKLIGGITHQVMYGNEKRTFGLDLSKVGTFIYAFTGKTYQGLSKVGNHIGSIDMAIQYDLETAQLMIYRQNLYDVGAIAHLANIADGINGISLRNTYPDIYSPIRWKKVLFEFIYTKNQAGGLSANVKSGDEDYYNNFEYTDGWTYYGVNLGNPLLTSRQYTRAGLANDPTDYIIDNRVVAFHLGAEAEIKDINILTKLTYSENYGTYGTSPEGHSTNTSRIKPVYGMFGKISQFSGYLEANKGLNNNFNIGAAVAFDTGGLYYNSVGLLLKLRKTFN